MTQPTMPLMPKAKALVPVTARGEATRQKLLAAAEVEFGARGFHAASVSSITNRADVGQGTFYLYFHSKEEIFINLVREIGRALRNLAAKAGAAAATAQAGEREGLIALLRYTLDYPGRYRIVQESQFVDETVFREYHDRLARSYAQSLSEGQMGGSFTDGDAETRAWAILGIGQILALRHCVWTGRMPSDEVIDGAMEMIENGIVAHTPDSMRRAA